MLLANILAADPTPQSHHDDTLDNVTTVVWLLIAIAIVAVMTKYIKLPYTIVLVLAGLAIAFIPGIPSVVLTPDLIVLVFLPVLLFEAAYNLSFKHLKENVRFISALALWGVLGTAAVVAGLLSWLGGLPWQTALLFGAIVAATDPVSVVAIFRKLGAPHRLTVTIEGESLFNDGSALVLFNLLVGIVVVGEFSLWGSLVEFVKVAVGGLALGVAGGYLALALLSRLNDYLTETLVTIITAYGVFLVAEQIKVSPALAVVAAGLLVGNFGLERAFTPASRIAVGLSWELFGFLANSLIFLLVGLEIRAINLTPYLGIIALGIGVTLFSRTALIVFFSWISNLVNRTHPIPFSWQLLLIWGGLRGALSLALALSLPVALTSGAPFPDREELLVMTFGLILFTLLVQGLTVEPLMKVLKLGRDTSEQLKLYEEQQGRLATARAARLAVEEMLQKRLLPENTCRALLAEYQEREEAANESLRELQMSNEPLEEEKTRATRRNLLQIERNVLRDLRGQGIIGEEVMRGLVAEINARISTLEGRDQSDTSFLSAIEHSPVMPSSEPEPGHPTGKPA